MAINDIVQAVKNTNWNKVDDFKVYLYSKSGLNADTIMEDVDISTLWQKSVISVQLPTVTTNTQQNYVGGEWRITNQKPEVFRVEMRFRDFNNGALRRYFNTLLTYAQFNYSQEAELSLSVTNRSDSKVLFSTEKALIEQVSEVTMDTTLSAITEFSVIFVSPTYSDDFLNNFGSAEYGAKFSAEGSVNNLETTISANQGS